MNSAVIAPMTSHERQRRRRDSSNSGDMRATMKMPAVTIVAAWISAEIGVGPSIESGSQTCSGNCALLPIAPMNRQMQIDGDQRPVACPAELDALRQRSPRLGEHLRVVERAEVGERSAPMPSMKPKSPTRLTRNAFRLAKIAVGRVYQKPISRYETRPTASQPKNSCRKLLLITSISIENVNSEM